MTIKTITPAEIAAALAQPGARLVISWSGGGYPIAAGIARPAEGYRDGVFFFRTIAEFPALRGADIPNAWIGSTNQGDSLADISEADLERLRAVDAERRGIAIATAATEQELVAAYADVVVAIPVDVSAERDRLRVAHTRGQNEGGDGYDPYEGWTGMASLALLGRRAPTAAAAIRDLRRRGL